ncbi:hypothetical protein ONR57_04295 [Hoyosella sp. YIM 151337]|uniref:hypothetical protein n=1 Tax=Hoyosella sp. YIM 151337 TaxID=2992742 RepID=UPI002236A136|nr:hypothetical protein [Hoyosella sp. YIM 151337]MCW4352521.1 hypothetical protein [Hoyosella sp. YIM 151337]
MHERESACTAAVSADTASDVRNYLARAAETATEAALAVHHTEQLPDVSAELNAAIDRTRQWLDTYARTRVQRAADLPAALDVVASVDTEHARQLTCVAQNAGLNL